MELRCHTVRGLEQSAEVGRVERAVPVLASRAARLEHLGEGRRSECRGRQLDERLLCVSLDGSRSADTHDVARLEPRRADDEWINHAVPDPRRLVVVLGRIRDADGLGTENGGEAHRRDGFSVEALGVLGRWHVRRCRCRDRSGRCPGGRRCSRRHWTGWSRPTRRIRQRAGRAPRRRKQAGVGCSRRAPRGGGDGCDRPHSNY